MTNPDSETSDTYYQRHRCTNCGVEPTQRLVAIDREGDTDRRVTFACECTEMLSQLSIPDVWEVDSHE